MRRKNLGAVIAVSLAMAIMPLSCGDDEPTSDEPAGGARAGAPGTGGSEATGGRMAAGMGGEDTSGGEATGGTSGPGGASARGGASGRGGTEGTGENGGQAGVAGEMAGGMGNAAGEGGASGGGASGGPRGGEGGEIFTDEATERLKRICQKTMPLGCADYSTCIENFRWLSFAQPYCGPYNERLLNCLDTQATIEDFGCNSQGKPSINIQGPTTNHCYIEAVQGANAYC